MNKKQKDKERARIESFDRALKDKFATAFMIAPALSVMILSVVYQSFSSTKIALDETPGIALGWLTLLTVAAAIVLAVMYNKTFVTLAFSLLFGLSSVSYGIVILSGTTDILEDSFFEMLMSVFVLPVISYISVTGVSDGVSRAVPLVISLVITAASIGATVYIFKKIKNAEKERERKAEACKSDNSRRKVR